MRMKTGRPLLVCRFRLIRTPCPEWRTVLSDLSPTRPPWEPHRADGKGNQQQADTVLQRAGYQHRDTEDAHQRGGKAEYPRRAVQQAGAEPDMV